VTIKSQFQCPNHCATKPPELMLHVLPCECVIVIVMCNCRQIDVMASIDKRMLIKTLKQFLQPYVRTKADNFDVSN